MFPEFTPGHGSRRSCCRRPVTPTLNVFYVVVQTPGRRRAANPAARPKAYLQIVAATNFKQRVRKMMEYFHADRLELRGRRHAQPARVRPGLLREAGRRRRRREADRAPLQDAGLRAGAAPRRARGDPATARRRPTPTRCRRRRRSSTSRCPTRRWTCASGRRTTASRPARSRAAHRASPPSRSSASTATSTRSAATTALPARAADAAGARPRAEGFALKAPWEF